MVTIYPPTYLSTFSVYYLFCINSRVRTIWTRKPFITYCLLYIGLSVGCRELKLCTARVRLPGYYSLTSRRWQKKKWKKYTQYTVPKTGFTVLWIKYRRTTHFPILIYSHSEIGVCLKITKKVWLSNIEKWRLYYSRVISCRRCLW